MNVTRPATILLLPCLMAAGQFSEHMERGKLSRANGVTQSYNIRMLPPASYPEVPASIRATLEARDCLIPQTYQAHEPENVVRGEFRQRGSNDWAVLCSHAGLTTLLIFFDNDSQPPAEVASHLNSDMTAVHDLSGVLGFAWGIDPAHPMNIKAHGGNKTAGPFDHDGIEDAFLEKDSSIHYFKNGKWLVLEGSD